MKRSERHHLKENELVQLVDRTRDVVTARRREIMMATLVVVVIAIAAIAYFAWRTRTESNASALLADAMTTLEAQVLPAAPPAPGQTAPKPPAGTFPTERARLEAALPKLAAVYTRYPSTDSALTARYYEANALATLDRRQDAQAKYQALADEGGIYGRMARLGLADLLASGGQHDQAIGIYKELSSDPNADLPLDGILMHLGRVYQKAGRQAEAQQTYTRIVQEFPESLYAADARRELEALKKS
jgi:tetratricopeptide (TPR) repeat protein